MRLIRKFLELLSGEEVPPQLKVLGITREQMRQLRSETERAVNTPPRIALIGETGVGKSSTINALFNAGREVSHTQACTQSDLERAWDTMNYCLSALRREEPGTADDALMDVAIRGEASVAPHVFGLQGEPLMQTSPETVKRIAHHLETLPFDTLLRRFGPQLLHGVQYKGPSADSRDWYCDMLRGLFTGFRAFYLTAASHGDHVLVLLD